MRDMGVPGGHVHCVAAHGTAPAHRAADIKGWDATAGKMCCRYDKILPYRQHRKTTVIADSIRAVTYLRYRVRSRMPCCPVWRLAGSRFRRPYLGRGLASPVRRIGEFEELAQFGEFSDRIGANVLVSHIVQLRWLEICQRLLSRPFQLRDQLLEEHFIELSRSQCVSRDVSRKILP